MKLNLDGRQELLKKVFAKFFSGQEITVSYELSEVLNGLINSSGGDLQSIYSKFPEEVSVLAKISIKNLLESDSVYRKENYDHSRSHRPKRHRAAGARIHRDISDSLFDDFIQAIEQEFSGNRRQIPTPSEVLNAASPSPDSSTIPARDIKKHLIAEGLANIAGPVEVLVKDYLKIPDGQLILFRDEMFRVLCERMGAEKFGQRSHVSKDINVFLGGYDGNIKREFFAQAVEFLKEKRREIEHKIPFKIGENTITIEGKPDNNYTISVLGTIKPGAGLLPKKADVSYPISGTLEEIRGLYEAIKNRRAEIGEKPGFNLVAAIVREEMQTLRERQQGNSGRIS